MNVPLSLTKFHPSWEEDISIEIAISNMSKVFHAITHANNYSANLHILQSLDPESQLCVSLFSTENKNKKNKLIYKFKNTFFTICMQIFIMNTMKLPVLKVFQFIMNIP